jgi:hypothetical protein
MKPAVEAERPKVERHRTNFNNRRLDVNSSTAKGVTT